MDVHWKAAETVKHEMLTSIDSLVIEDSHRIIKAFDETVLISPPGFEAVMIVKANFRKNDFRSNKPGNIFINISSFLEKTLDISLFVSSGYLYIKNENNFIAVLALLNIIKIAYKMATITLTRGHAEIMLVLKENNADQAAISEDLFIEDLMKKSDIFDSKKDISNLLDDMVNLNCIHLFNGKISMKEQILVEY